jgi:hypothetical protein
LNIELHEIEDWAAGEIAHDLSAAGEVGYPHGESGDRRARQRLTIP